MRLFEIINPANPPRVHPSHHDQWHSVRVRNGSQAPEPPYDPEWDNDPKEEKKPWYDPEAKAQSNRRMAWVRARAKALRHEDLLLKRRVEDFENMNQPEPVPNDVIIAAFPSVYDKDYQYEQGVPTVVQENPDDYIAIKIPHSWFHEDMRTKSRDDENLDFRDESDDARYDDAHEMCYIRKTFKYRREVERMVHRHNQIEKLLRSTHDW